MAQFWNTQSGTVRILSNSKGLKCIQDDTMRNSISILRTPQFWSDKNLRTNFFRREDVKKGCKLDCESPSQKLFIQSNPSFGFLYVKKLRNNAAVPKRGSEEAAGYDIASAGRHSSSPRRAKLW